MELRLSSHTQDYILLELSLQEELCIYIQYLLINFQMTLREYNTLGLAPFDPTLPPRFLHIQLILLPCISSEFYRTHTYCKQSHCLQDAHHSVASDSTSNHPDSVPVLRLQFTSDLTPSNNNC